MKVTLGKQFSNELNKLDAAIKLWKEGGHKELKRRFRIIGVRVKGQAQRRVPVRSNRLKQQIITVTNEDESGNLVTEVGTNVKSKKGFPYPVVLEFGSKHIAQGRVKMLGEESGISDAEAVTEWPAKTARQGGGKQQMPWLRPAWNAVLPEAIEFINGALEPPSQK